MRTCGSCSLCCKVMEIKELKKPMNKWCSHCAKGGGCSIYPTRPAECRTFDCLWLKDESLPHLLTLSPSTGSGRRLRGEGGCVGCGRMFVVKQERGLL